MAKALLTISSSFLILLVIITMTITVTAAADDDGYSRLLSPAKLRLKKEKLSHLRFYFHDLVSGSEPTSVPVARAPSTDVSSTSFGLVHMFDDPLTIGPEINSTLVGRAQGIYGSAAQTEIGLLMALNFFFVEGKFNGSTLSVLGRNSGTVPVREMPVIGGSGAFRFARGYAQARTSAFEPNGDAVVEYNVYVFHY